jgi:hypothetical protein
VHHTPVAHRCSLLSTPAWSTMDPSRAARSTIFSIGKQIREIQKSLPFCKEAPVFLCNQAAFHNFQEDPQIFKNNSRYTPCCYQKLQIGPNKFLSPHVCNRNSNFSDSCAKILIINSSFILCIHLTHVCCILLTDCICFVLDNAMPEPFFEDFHDQAFEESQFFSLWSSKASAIDHFCAYHFLVYSVVCRNCMIGVSLRAPMLENYKNH